MARSTPTASVVLRGLVILAGVAMAFQSGPTRFVGIFVLVVMAAVTVVSGRRAGATEAETGAATEAPPDPRVRDRVLWLDEVGERQVAVIKAIREVTSCDLRTAKGLVDAARRTPQRLERGLDEEEARHGLRMLQEAGAQGHVSA